jgi:hypothetical protein
MSCSVCTVGRASDTWLDLAEFVTEMGGEVVEEKLLLSSQ